MNGQSSLQDPSLSFMLHIQGEKSPPSQAHAYQLWGEEAYRPKITGLFFIAESTHSHRARADYYSANTPSPSTSVGYTSPQLNFGLAMQPAWANGILVDMTQAKAWKVSELGIGGLAFLRSCLLSWEHFSGGCWSKGSRSQMQQTWSQWHLEAKTSIRQPKFTSASEQ